MTLVKADVLSVTLVPNDPTLPSDPEVECGLVVAGRVVPKLEFARGFDEIDGLFVTVVDFFVVVAGRFVDAIVVGLAVLLPTGFLVIVTVDGLSDVVFLGGNLVEGASFCVVVRTFFVVVVDCAGLRVVDEIGFCEVNVGLCTVVVGTGFFVVAFKVVVITGSFVAPSVLGRRLDEMDGFVGFLVVLGDTLDSLLTVSVEFVDNITVVLDPPSEALCTVWNVERRVVCVVISTVVIVGFFVTNFVVSLNVLAEVCALWVLGMLDVV